MKTIKIISEEFGFSEDDIRKMVYEYINNTKQNITFDWDRFYEFLIIENRDKKLEKILSKD